MFYTFTSLFLYFSPRPSLAAQHHTSRCRPSTPSCLLSCQTTQQLASRTSAHMQPNLGSHAESTTARLSAAATAARTALETGSHCNGKLGKISLIRSGLTLDSRGRSAFATTAFKPLSGRTVNNQNEKGGGGGGDWARKAKAMYPKHHPHAAQAIQRQFQSVLRGHLLPSRPQDCIALKTFALDILTNVAMMAYNVAARTEKSVGLRGCVRGNGKMHVAGMMLAKPIGIISLCGRLVDSNCRANVDFPTLACHRRQRQHNSSYWALYHNPGLRYTDGFCSSLAQQAASSTSIDQISQPHLELTLPGSGTKCSASCSSLPPEARPPRPSPNAVLVQLACITRVSLHTLILAEEEITIFQFWSSLCSASRRGCLKTRHAADEARDLILSDIIMSLCSILPKSPERKKERWCSYSQTLIQKRERAEPGPAINSLQVPPTNRTELVAGAAQHGLVIVRSEVCTIALGTAGWLPAFSSHSRQILIIPTRIFILTACPTGSQSIALRFHSAFLLRDPRDVLFPNHFGKRLESDYQPFQIHMTSAPLSSSIGSQSHRNGSYASIKANDGPEIRRLRSLRIEVQVIRHHAESAVRPSPASRQIFMPGIHRIH
ncbi:uncharacterized protein MYCFIDRAFT_180397 [Pseudocercospora fijiensis CIRAD86]|uniref:Uncharacterized protein n=1 Tax=Pseudocercospora fijiensis (strain CIRAD86) TaxID=383855 RepID=M2ZY67_PSEFD|nr:uncharacterized protein MYCFIDRAFT_180397 [Pseudocercospora fijiensis CIRAD86]EME77061.1 hypothetical protein MYCFIDRAFT_180397 [Pseudocercospora fijiensis CIRAD86]